MKKVLSLIAVFVLIFSLVSCGKKRREDNGKPNIIATLFPQYDFARAIVGDKANVKMLLSPGTDSHDYDPTPSAALEISQCDLFVYTGDNMEMWAATLLTNVDRQKVYVLDCTQGIEFKASDDDHEHGHEHELDPHVWTSPVNAIKMVENILDAICAVDGENAAFYKANAEKYIKQLDALDAEFREVVANGIRKEVVFGSRFALKYFADEYGLSYTAAIASCESEDEPSVSVMNAWIRAALRGRFCSRPDARKATTALRIWRRNPLLCRCACRRLRPSRYRPRPARIPPCTGNSGRWCCKSRPDRLWRGPAPCTSRNIGSPSLWR